MDSREMQGGKPFWIFLRRETWTQDPACTVWSPGYSMEVSSWTVWTEPLESGKNIPMDIPDIPGFKNDMAFWIILTDLLHINSIAGSKDVVFRIQACCKSLWEHQEKHHYCPNGCPKNYPYMVGIAIVIGKMCFFSCELWMEWGSPIFNKSSSADSAWPDHECLQSAAPQPPPVYASPPVTKGRRLRRHSACCQQHPSPSHHAPHSTGMFCNDCDVPNSQYLPSSQRCPAFYSLPLWSIVVLTLSRWSRQNAPALVQIVCPIQSIHHISRQLELNEGHRSGWNNSNCPMTYCMLGFSQAVLFFILLQLFHYSGNHWYSKRKMFDMFSSQRLFTFWLGGCLWGISTAYLKKVGAIQFNKLVVKSAATVVSWKCTQRTQQEIKWRMGCEGPERKCPSPLL